MNKKLIAIILAIVIVTTAVVLGVVLGGKKGDTTDTPKETTIPAKGELAGIVLLNAGGSVEILYDVDGLVMSVAGFGANGIELAKEMDTAVGKPCKDIVGVLTEKAVKLDYVTAETKMIVVKEGVDSYLPTKDFLDGCVDAVKAAAEGINIVLLTEKDMNPNGNISLESCQVLLKKYLNLSGDVTFDGPMKPYGSKYYLSTKYLEDTVYYTVDASDGTIKTCSKTDFEMVSTMGFLPEEIEQGNTAEETVDPEYTYTVE
ncbi:MAG: hypothetical protein J6Q92_03985 [Oscillospiraceae bacterium]|nr:hypothetical protein [Oscillospiraceae bacterium]